MLKEEEISESEELEFDYIINYMFYLYFFHNYLFHGCNLKRMSEKNDKR